MSKTLVELSDVINAIENWYQIPVRNMNMLTDAVQSLPTQQSKDEWIDVKEKLPEEPGFYICYVPMLKYKRVDIYFDGNEFNHYKSKISHWTQLRELPSPPTK